MNEILDYLKKDADEKILKQLEYISEQLNSDQDEDYLCDSNEVI